MSTPKAGQPMADTRLDQLCINTIRTLSMDAVQQAKPGHPGAPMALAPLVYTLWNRVMRFDPQDPIWPNRDLAKKGAKMNLRTEVGYAMHGPRAQD